MSKQQKIPKLRFPGFLGEWEERKLKDVSTFENGKAHEDSIVENGKFIVVNSKFVSTSGAVAKFSNSSLCPLNQGDLTMVMSDVPNGKALAKCFVIDKNEKYTLNQRICAIRATKSIGKFLYYQLDRNPYYLQFDSGVGQTNLKKEEVLNCPLILPTLPEQQKIAQFLTAIDEKINQLTRQKALLEQYKKGVMQQIFSRELRFRDADGEAFGEWEVRRLREVCDINPSTQSLPDEFIYIDLESVEKGVLLKEEWISKNEAPSRAQRLLNQNDIIYQTVRPYQKNNYFFEKTGVYVASTGYAQIRTQNVPRYIYQLLHTEDFVQDVMLRCTGTSYPSINSSDLSQIKIPLPTLPEQQKIADFLTALDEKISRVAGQVEAVKGYKRGLLQGMFV